jgi:diguanylate cyclase (GGDEF)-like protein
VRPGDTAARFGGDEFTFLCENSSAAEAALVADRVADAVDVPITVDGHADVHLSVSIGIAIAGSAAVTAEMLLRDADVAMYAARTARACATRSSTSGCGAAPPRA